MQAGEVSRALSLLFEPGQVVEVRAITEEGMASGYFDDPAALVAAVEPLDATGTAGIYVTLNEVDPALLSRRANRVKMRLSKKDATTADSDIVRRRWFPVDIDPVRPSGVSSTDQEHQSALGRAREIAAYLAERGWPDPVLADSGNGAHLLYRIDMPNDEESRDLVKRGLEALDVMLSDRSCTVDTANHNAARIWKLYGTTSRKGDNTRDRPHRNGVVLEAPESIGIVDRDLLEGLTASLPVQPAQKGTGPRGQKIDLRSWLTGHGIGIAGEKPYRDGTLFVLDECPFSGEHRDGAFAIQFGSGAVHAGCHHASCGGGSQRWQELREKYEPGEKRSGPQRSPAAAAPGSRRQPSPSRLTGEDHAHGRDPNGVLGNHPNGTGKDLTHGGDPSKGSRESPSVLTGELPGREEALAVLQHGDPKQAMLRAFALDHEGDEVVAECLVMSLASRSVINTNGLHVSVSGESGKGKSHAFATMLRQVPDRYRLEGAMSNKALFYLEDLQPGSAIVFDDRALSEEMAEILKGVTTSFRKPFVYRTVTKDRKGQVCTIPERCVWWVAKVEGAGDDQVFNRMLTCWIDDSGEQDTRVLARVLSRDQEFPDSPGDERPGVLACRAMWEVLGQQRFHVVIPFATRIRFRAVENRRNPEMLLDLVKANAVLRFMQREQRQAGSVPCLIATLEDFEEAARLYGLLNGTSGGQETKLTKREAGLIEVIVREGWPEFTVPMLQKSTGWSNGNIHKIIHGYTSRGTEYSGLLEKCPAISYCDRTVVTGEEADGVSMRRRTNAYAFDRDLYRLWYAGGTVWLDDDHDGDANTFATSANFSSPAAGAKGQKIDGKDSDSPNNGYNKNKYISTCDHFRTSPDTQQPESQGVGASPCDCDPGNVEAQKSKLTDTHPIFNCTKEKPPITLQQGSAATGNGCRDCRMPPSPPPTPVTSDPPPGVDVHDYKPLEHPEKRPCYVCGSPWSFYQEKLTEERRQRKDQDARTVCKRCYDTARRYAQDHATILPGTFDLSRMEPLKANIGRCTVCKLDTATRVDRAARVYLCEYCYQRLARDQGKEEVST